MQDNSRYILTILLFLTCQVVCAHNKQPIFVESDTASFDQIKGLITYTNNVKLHQATTTLTADVIIANLDQNRKLSNAKASGTTKTQAHYWDTQTKDGSKFHAYADTIEYLPKQNQIILIGNASLLRDNNSYKAQRIEYNTITKQVSSPNMPNKKVTLIFEVN